MQGGAIEAAAAAAAARHGPPVPGRVRRPAWTDHRRGDAFLTAAAAAARSAPADASGTAAWLLDNLYIARRVVAALGPDMPEAFWRRLPLLPAEGAGGQEQPVPRIVAVADAYLAATRCQVSAGLLGAFLRVYQQQVPLMTSELWALPTALRLLLLDRLAAGLAAAFPGLCPPPSVLPPRPGPAPPPGEAVASAITGLAEARTISWLDLFDRLSPIEAALAEDPAGIYPDMTFETRDRYRRAVETVARWAGMAEPEVAAAAVARAAAEPAGAPGRHVGFWLEGEARARFEAGLGARPPAGVRLRRALRRHAWPLYALTLALGTLAALLVPAALLSGGGARWDQWLVGLAASLLPASMVATTVLHRLLTLVVKPRLLPALDFSRGIRPDCATAVVMPVLVRNASEAEDLAARLEAHFLASRDPALAFVLLSDLADAASAETPADAAIEQALAAAVDRLNQRHGTPGQAPFHLLHRRRSWCESEGLWLGRERKRGKLEDFNRLVLSGETGPFALRVGQTARLRRCRFAITLDADTRLPPGVAAGLAGILAHPLNRPVFDQRTGRVVRGYTVLQPRVEPLPADPAATPYARLQTGDSAIDIYATAVSDIYQDLFGEGIFAGKGIYDIAAFSCSLEGRVPPQSILSHDLFEGLHGRAGLVSNLVVYEAYPRSHVEQAARVHRWIRGDWQLLPWLGRMVPDAENRPVPTRFDALGRWKLFDNLRRSLLAPAVVAMAVAGWLVLPGPAFGWTILAFLAPALGGLTDLVAGLAPQRWAGGPGGMLRRAATALARIGLAATFVLDDARVAADAIVRTLWRLRLRRRLLEWRTAAEVRARSHSAPPVRMAMAMMWPGSALAIALAVLVATAQPEAFAPALLLLLPWAVAPLVAGWLARPPREARNPLGEAERQFLRAIARRTWLFFETFVRPETNWLPPDNHHETGLEEEVWRTSPTNIGMMFLASLAALRLGYLSVPALAERTRRALDSLDRIPLHRGHVPNWIDTRTLEPLEPNYVSTVDSGNLACSLVTLAAGLEAARRAPPVGEARFRGLGDTFGILGECLAPGGDTPPQLAAAAAEVAVLGAMVGEVAGEPRRWAGYVEATRKTALPRLKILLADAVAAWEDPAPDQLSDLQLWFDRASAQLGELGADLEAFPDPVRTVRAHAISAGALAAVEARMAAGPGLAAQAEASALAAELCAAEAPVLPPDAQAQAAAASARLARAAEALRELDTELATLARRARAMAAAMDFTLLHDRSTRLFRIGYNLATGELDRNFYDLLASESRLASYFAIASRQVPDSHWAALGRPVARLSRGLALISWSGSMFEYLMPRLLLAPPPQTLLHEAERAAVFAQIAHARRLGLPWGVSEAGYAARDASGHFQYQGFGVPGLGLRRGLENDRVVAPYATLLALAVTPSEAVRNLRRLAGLGLLRRYGFIEAADFTPQRLPAGRAFLPVSEYMAHHQGMGLAALVNALEDDWLVELFRSDPEMAIVDLLLAERIPWDARPEPAAPEEAAPVRETAQAVADASWTPVAAGALPAMHVVGNGRVGQQLVDRGGGSLLFEGQLVARSPGLGTGTEALAPLFLRDGETGLVFRLGQTGEGGEEPSFSALFAPHGGSFRARMAGLSVGLTLAVAADDDLECLILGITNETGRSRVLDLLFVREMILNHPQAHARHPGFSRLFVESRFRPQDRSLVFRRRPLRREDAHPVALVRLLSDDPGFQPMGHETDRARLFPAPADPLRPRFGDGPLSGTTGFTLDPVAGLAARMVLAPDARVEVAQLTAMARSEKAAAAILDRYQTVAAVRWAAHAAASATAARLATRGVLPADPPAWQALLSRLLATRPLAARAEMPAAAGTRQSDLWPAGISGDDPLLAVISEDGHESPVLAALLRGHRMARELGVRVDIVILFGGDPGYSEPVRDRLLRQLREAGAIDRLGHRGGVHLVPLASEPLRRAVLAAAVEVLDARETSLERALEPLPAWPDLPHFHPSGVVPDAAPPAVAPRPMLFATAAGGFDPETGDYLLTGGQRPPAPWSNVIANPGFGTLVSDRGLGFTWAVNSGEFRLTPWRNDPVFDPPAECLYLRDEVSAHLWAMVPDLSAPGAGGVRHAPGATRFTRTDQGLDQELDIGVAPDAPVKIVRLRLRNRTAVPRRVTATYYAEWLLGTTAGATDPYLAAAYDADSGAILACNSRSADFAGMTAFLASDRPAHGLSVSRTAFLGPLGNRARPDALTRWGLGSILEARGDCCGAFQVHLDIAPGATAEACFLLGAGGSADEARALVADFRSPGRAAAALAESRARWDGLLGRVSVRTPDPAFDLMVNRWFPTQALAARLFARAGPAQASGAFGFRDQLQDVIALLWHDPLLARRHILEAASHQFAEGDVLHWWHPPAGQGVRTRCSDDLLWLPQAVAAYVEATGDVAVLDEPVPFLAGEPLAPGERERYATWGEGETAPLFDHVARALERGHRIGRNGLPLIGTGDWNDGLDRVGEAGAGTSVWLGWFLISTIDAFTRLARRAGRPEAAACWAAPRRALMEAIERHGWDGGWYLRAIDDAGEPWGSAANSQCRIDLIAQAWAVLSGAADPERARRAMDAAAAALAEPDGRLIRLLAPPFSRGARDPGYIAAYPPGIRENGGQYSHAAVWYGMARARLGDGDAAKAAFDCVNPLSHTRDDASVARYRAEPYVCAADIAGVPPHIGRAGWTWYTGAAGWAFRLAVEEILGLRLVAGGLAIAPVLPRGWEGARATIRRGAGAIEVIIRGGGSGPWRLVCEGREVEGPVAFPEAGVRRVEVVGTGGPARRQGTADAPEAGTGGWSPPGAAGRDEVDAAAR